jgi:hypothetical protein
LTYEEDNKHLKKNWLRYGLETLVVVNGVLIAFALNNWNEEEKNRKAELALLEKFKIDIQNNILEHKNDLANAQLSYISSLEVLKFIENGIHVENNSLDSFSTLNLYTPFFPNSSAFQAMKSGGMHLISNEKLRGDISFYYEVFADRLIFWQSSSVNYPPLILDEYIKKNFHVDVSYNLDSLLQLDLKNLEVLAELNSLYDGKEKKTYGPNDINLVLNDSEFKIVLLKSIKGATSLIRLHTNSIKRLEEILLQLEQEIEWLK